MHEHLCACIRDIGALQTDMWTKGQMDSENRRVKQMPGHTVYLYMENAGGKVIPTSKLKKKKKKVSKSLYKLFLYNSMFIHQV